MTPACPPQPKSKTSICCSSASASLWRDELFAIRYKPSPAFGSSEGGQVLVATVVMIGTILVITSVLFSIVTAANRQSIRAIQVLEARHLAEAGIEHGLMQLKQDGSYLGETDVSLGGGTFTVSLTGNGNTRTISATGSIPNSANPLVEESVAVDVELNTTDVQFFYGIQVGEGGLAMGNNAQVTGNVFSNGHIDGNNGATITGDAIVAGGLGSPATSIETQNNDQPFGDVISQRDIAQSFVTASSGNLTQLSVYLKKIGSPGNLPLKIVADNNNNPSKTVLGSTTISAANVGTTYSWVTVNFSSPSSLTAGTRYWVVLDYSLNTSNHYVWGEMVSQAVAVGFETPTTDADLANFPSNNSGSGDAAQSFTTPSSGLELTSVDLLLKRPATAKPSNVYVEIRSSSTVGTVLGTSATVTSSSIPTTGPTWTAFSFTSPITLAGSTRYYLRFRSTPSSTVAFSGSQPVLYWTYQQTASSPYSGGDAYRYIGRNNNASDQGQILTQYDFGFRAHSNPTTAGGRLSRDWNAGSPVWTHAFGDLNYRVWIGGSAQHIDNVTVNGTARANSLLNSAIGTDAYYQTLTNTTVAGTQYPGSPDADPQNLPISDGTIADWQADAEAGGISTGTYTLTNGATASLGPIKIIGDLVIDNNAILTITGTIWVTGNITLSNNCQIGLDPGYGDSSGLLITDGVLTVSNNCAFTGSGTAGSYVMALSAQDATGNEIITVDNNSTGVIYYAGKGRIRFSNNATAKEATGYGITMDNNAVVTYESGLADMHFSSGPGGGWSIVPGSWRLQ